LAAFQLLGIKSPEKFQTAIKTKKKREEKEEFLTQLSSDIVMQFVETKQFHYCNCFSGIVALLLVYVIIREVFNVHQLDIHHRVAQRVLHMEQELLTLPQQLNSVGFALLHI
jgi:hypothetical protein